MQSSKVYIFTYSISISNLWTIFQFVKLKTPFVFVITYVATVEHCLEELMFLFWWNSVQVLQCEMCSYGRDSFTQKGECRNEKRSKACMKTCGKGLSVVWGNFRVGTVWFHSLPIPWVSRLPLLPFGSNLSLSKCLSNHFGYLGLLVKNQFNKDTLADKGLGQDNCILPGPGDSRIEFFMV